MKFNKIIFTLLLSMGVSLLWAKQVPSPMNPPRLVNDYIGLLTPSEAIALERKLVAYDDSTSTEIAIVIERSIDGDDVFEYSNRLAREWGIGGEDNNGVLIYIAYEDRKTYIQTGYGVEGFLPDVLAKRILDEVIRPAFRNEQYFEGLNAATDVIIRLGAGEYTNDQPFGNRQRESSRMPPMAVLIIIITIIVIFNSIFRDNGGRGGGGYYGGGRYGNRGGGGWIILPGGGFGSGSSGGGWGGGGGDFGGFGGFGGGDFGGGGAGGDW